MPYYPNQWPGPRVRTVPLDSLEVLPPFIYQEPIVRQVIAVLDKRYQSSFLVKALRALKSAVLNISKDESLK